MDQLPRRLGLIDASLIVIGVVIGSGIFLLPNVIARSLPSGAAMLAVWVVAGVLSYFGALAYAELGAMMPATGGQYVYLREAFGQIDVLAAGRHDAGHRRPIRLSARSLRAGLRLSLRMGVPAGGDPGRHGVPGRGLLHLSGPLHSPLAGPARNRVAGLVGGAHRGQLHRR